MSVPSAAFVKFRSLGKFLALDICCIVVNALSVAISRYFEVNFEGSVRVYWKIIG